MNEKVSVTVNGRAARFFLGLTVRHAIGAHAVRAVREGRAEVRDRDGNVGGLEGALYQGQELVVRDLPPSVPSARSDVTSAYTAVRRWAQDRLLGDESLRAGLNDEEARVLLRWATEHLETWITAQSGDENYMRDCLRGVVRRVSVAMRGIALLVAATDAAGADSAANGLAALLAQSGAIVDASVFTKEKNSLSGVDLVRKLASLVDGLLPRPSGGG